MAAKNDEEKKVMDVASPGQAKPDTGSKPMVVGHKFLSSDPDVKQTDTNNSETESSSDALTVPKKKIVLEPISDNIKTETEEPTKPEENKQQSEAPEQTNEIEDNKQETVTEAEVESKEVEKEQTAEEKQSKIDKANLEKEERLQEIIKSKEFYVPIKHQGASAVKTFLLTFAVVCILGVLLLVVLLDAEIIDLGVELPFDFL